MLIGRLSISAYRLLTMLSPFLDRGDYCFRYPQVVCIYKALYSKGAKDYSLYNCL